MQMSNSWICLLRLHIRYFGLAWCRCAFTHHEACQKEVTALAVGLLAYLRIYCGIYSNGIVAQGVGCADTGAVPDVQP